MKDLRGRIVAGVIAFVGVFSVVFFVVLANTEKNKEEDMNRSGNIKSREIVTPIPEKDPMPADELTEDDNDYEPADIKISSDTEYIVETYIIDDKNKTPESKTMNMPSEFIAMDESALNNYLEEYMNNMPVEEHLEGLLSYEIVSFDKDRLVLRKTYASTLNENDYYVSDINGEIVVYYSDKETIYEYTGIRTENLQPEEQVKIKLGYYVKNEEELYGMLESYSS